MINLLPPDEQQAIIYARHNTMLRRWCFALIISTLLLIAIVIFGQIYIRQSIEANKEQVATAQTLLKEQKLDETQKRVEEISGSLKLVLQVLNKEILFSKLIQQIGAAMPPNTVLTGLSLSDKVDAGIDLQARGVDFRAATQVQVNLKDPANRIFQNADIVSTQCAADTTTAQSATGTVTADNALARAYPCTISIRAQFAQNNNFTFIGAGAKQ